MEQEHKISDRLNDLERSLGEIRPAAARLDVAQTMFLAGQASTQRRHQIMWPTISACLALLSLSLGVLLVNQEDARVAGGAERVLSTDAADDAKRPNNAGRETESEETSQGGESDRLPSDSSGAADTQEEWQDPLEQILRQRLALLGNPDLPDLTASASSDDSQVTLDAMRYGDWKSMLDADGPVESSSPTFQFGPFRWIDIFQARGI